MNKEHWKQCKEELLSGRINDGMMQYFYEYYKQKTNKDLAGSQAEFNYKFQEWMNTPVTTGRNEHEWLINQRLQTINKGVKAVTEHFNKIYGE